MSHSVEGGTAITGVVVLAIPEDKRFTYPTQLAVELSKRVERIGDVSGMIVAS